MNPNLKIPLDMVCHVLKSLPEPLRCDAQPFTLDYSVPDCVRPTYLQTLQDRFEFNQKLILPISGMVGRVLGWGAYLIYLVGVLTSMGVFGIWLLANLEGNEEAITLLFIFFLTCIAVLLWVPHSVIKYIFQLDSDATDDVARLTAEMHSCTLLQARHSKLIPILIHLELGVQEYIALLKYLRLYSDISIAHPSTNVIQTAEFKQAVVLGAYIISLAEQINRCQSYHILAPEGWMSTEYARACAIFAATPNIGGSSLR